MVNFMSYLRKIGVKYTILTSIQNKVLGFQGCWCIGRSGGWGTKKLFSRLKSLSRSILRPIRQFSGLKHLKIQI